MKGNDLSLSLSNLLYILPLSLPLSVLENYFKWHLVLQYISFLGDDFLSVYYQYTQSIYGSGKKERYLTCVGALEGFVPMTVSRLYTDYVLAPGQDNFTYTKSTEPGLLITAQFYTVRQTGLTCGGPQMW